MDWKTIITVMLGAFIAVGALFFIYQLHNVVVIDAKARGVKHPRFWGVFIMGRNTGGGLLLYLIRRRKYPILNMTEQDRLEISKRKKATGIGLLFVALGASGVIICQMLL